MEEILILKGNTLVITLNILCHRGLVNHNGIAVSKMNKDMFRLSWSISINYPIHDLSKDMTYHWYYDGYCSHFQIIRRMQLVKQELLTLLEHLSSPPFLVGFVLLDL